MKLDELLSFARRKGFVWQSAELYGGTAGFYDYGHNGAALKRKWEDAWLQFVFGLSDNNHLIDSAHIMPASALKASGHVAHFSDIVVECFNCKASHRADTLIEDKTGTSAEDLSCGEINSRIAESGIKCPKCGGTLSGAAPFNLMYPVSVGAKQNELAYLRPETAQGVYLNFSKEYELLRRKLPLGLAIIGRAYRNEIAPRQVLYRLRELIQAELQIFFDPEKFNSQVDFASVSGMPLNVSLVSERDACSFRQITAGDLVKIGVCPVFFAFHMAAVQQFYVNKMGIPQEKFRFREKSEKERAFYNRLHFDVEVNLSSLGGFREVAGIHYRGDYDLTCHQNGSGKSQEINVDGRKFIPHVLELSFGVDRNLWTLLDIHYTKEGDRSILKLPTSLASLDVGVFPLMARDGLDEKAREVSGHLKIHGLRVFYDESGSIGRRYARMDEIGTPFCITVDYDTLKNNDVTIRERNSAKQFRVPVAELPSKISELLGRSVCGRLA